MTTPISGKPSSNPASSSSGLEADIIVNSQDAEKNEAYQGKDTSSSLGALSQVPPTVEMNAPVLPPPSKVDEVNAYVQPYPAEKQNAINQKYENLCKAMLEELGLNLNVEEKKSLKAAFSSNTLPSEPGLLGIFAKATAAATDKIQAEYNLPITWIKGSSEPIDWTPNVQFSETEPLQAAVKVAENTGVYLKNLMGVVEKILEKIDPSNPYKPALDDLIIYLTSVISELKQILQEISMKDEEKDEEITGVKAKAAEARVGTVQKELAEEAKKRAKQAKLEKIMKAVKIAGYVAAVTGVIIGAATAWSGGGVPLMMASLAVGSLLATYSIVDGEMGLSAKAFEQLSKGIEKLTPNCSDAQRAAIKFALIGAIAAVLVAAAIMAGNPSEAASMTGQVVREVVSQASIQLAIVVVASSQAGTELVVEVMKSMGFDEKTSRIAGIVFMVVEMIALIAVIAAGKGGKAIKKTFSEIGNELLAGLKEVPKNLKDAVLHFVDLVKQVPTTLEEVQALALQIVEQMRKLVAALPKLLLDTAKSIGNDLIALYEGLKELGALGVTIRVLKAVPMTIQISGNIYKACTLIEISKILKNLGAFKAEEEMIQQLLSFLQKLIQSVQTGIQANVGFNESLQSLMKDTFKKGHTTMQQVLHVPG